VSYEGYTQALCKNGHLHVYECYDDPTSCPQWMEEKDFVPWKCPDCGAPLAWWNTVDQTNCCTSKCDYGLTEAEQVVCRGHGHGYADLEVIEEYVCVCEKCGNKHRSEVTRYKIPENKGHRQ